MICGILFGLKEPYENDEETHGICEDCFPIEMERIEREVKEWKEGKDGKTTT
jgi:hypothetical protein